MTHPVLFAIVALLAFAAALVVAIRNPAIAKFKDILVYEKVFGLWIAAGYWLGNTFSPAIVFIFKRPRRYWYDNAYRYPAFLTVTIRTAYSTETVLHFALNGIRLHSGHLAKWFGETIDATENGGPVYECWNPPHLLGKLIGQQVRM